jgi:transcriptional regulator of acetoin/glycerol metabolism
MIHDQSSRATAPFVSVNYAALTETLLESELFGHVRGAFTGATRDKAGLFEVAGRGTLFQVKAQSRAPHPIAAIDRVCDRAGRLISRRETQSVSS